MVSIPARFSDKFFSFFSLPVDIGEVVTCQENRKLPVLLVGFFVVPMY